MSASTVAAETLPAPRSLDAQKTVYAILVAVSVSHLVNDLIQSLIPAVYPILKTNFALDFGQIGLITLVFQLTASVLQPVVGLFTDAKPSPFSLVAGMGSTLLGLLLLSVAPNYPVVLVAAAMVGIGSSVFHPESSRIARMASGGRQGFAQSVFQIGGNAGQALGPLLAAFIIVPRGQGSIAWFAFAALAGIIILTRVSLWYARRLRVAPAKGAARVSGAGALSRRRVGITIAILVLLMFSKHFYLASFNTFYVFYLMERFALPVETAQVFLFAFLAAFAAGVLLGGPVGDRIGRRYVIWASILGVLPFSLVLPYANLFWTGTLSLFAGFILASATSAIIVYALELLPNRVGLVSGLFFGLAFGMGGLGAAVLGELADHTSIDFVYKVCAFLPALGLLAYFLPEMRERQTA